MCMFRRENLVLIEKYGRFVEYIYKPTINTNRKHKVARDALVLAIQEQHRFLASWRGHISHANSYNLQKRLGINEN